MQFKTPKIQTEFQELPNRNLKLYRLLHVVSEFSLLEFGKDIVITEILRTQAEQDALYAQTPVDKRPKSSPHMTWHAADIRSTVFTDAEKQRLKAFILNFSNKNGKVTALLHTISGNVEHFHISYGV